MALLSSSAIVHPSRNALSDVVENTIQNSNAANNQSNNLNPQTPQSTTLQNATIQNLLLSRQLSTFSHLGTFEIRAVRQRNEFQALRARPFPNYQMFAQNDHQLAVERFNRFYDYRIAPTESAVQALDYAHWAKLRPSGIHPIATATFVLFKTLRESDQQDSASLLAARFAQLLLKDQIGSWTAAVTVGATISFGGRVAAAVALGLGMKWSADQAMDAMPDLFSEARASIGRAIEYSERQISQFERMLEAEIVQLYHLH